MANRYVVFSESADSVAERAVPHAAAHRAWRLREWNDMFG